MKHDISKQKRLFFGSLGGLVIVMLVTGLLIAPTLSATATTGGIDKDKNKCGKKFKYHGICDRNAPDIESTFPNHFQAACTGNHCAVPPIHISGTAIDSESGVKNVRVCDTNPDVCKTVSKGNGAWSYDTVPLKWGHHKVTVTATDNAGNIKRLHIELYVIQN